MPALVRGMACLSSSASVVARVGGGHIDSIGGCVDLQRAYFRSYYFVTVCGVELQRAYFASCYFATVLNCSARTSALCVVLRAYFGSCRA